MSAYVYIMFNKKCGTLYIGVTTDIIRRVYEHKNKILKGFTSKYNLDKLAYYEVFEDIENAIFREKQLKAGNRENKIKLIEKLNPYWKDLSESL